MAVHIEVELKLIGFKILLGEQLILVDQKIGYPDRFKHVVLA